MFSKTKLAAGGQEAITAFLHSLDKIQNEEKSSTYTKVSIEKMKTAIKSMQTDPKEIIQLTELFGQDCLQVMLTDSHFRELFKKTITFIQENPPNKLWDSKMIKVAFSTIQSKWTEALESMRMTEELCSFLSRADKFAQAFKPDQRIPDQTPYIAQTTLSFDETRASLGSLNSSMVALKRANKALEKLTTERKDPTEQARAIEELTITCNETLARVVAQYNEAMRLFVTSSWDKVQQLPYYSIRAILPDSLASDIHDSNWNTTRMIMSGCREAVLFDLLAMEAAINGFAATLKSRSAVNSAHQYMQQTIRENKDANEVFAGDVNKELLALKKAVDEYLAPTSIKDKLKAKKMDPSKKALMQELQRDLTAAITRDAPGERLKRSFKAIMRACIWHSKILADSVSAGKPLSSGSVGKILKSHYSKLSNLYFSAHEGNSGEYQFRFPDYLAEAKSESARTATGSAPPAAIPVKKINVISDRGTPAELDKFNLSFTLLCGEPAIVKKFEAKS